MADSLKRASGESSDSLLRKLAYKAKLRRIGKLLSNLPPDKISEEKDKTTLSGHVSATVVSLCLREPAGGFGYDGVTTTTIDVTRNAAKPKQILGMEVTRCWQFRSSEISEHFSLGGDDNQLKLYNVMASVRTAANLAKAQSGTLDSGVPKL